MPSTTVPHDLAGSDFLGSSRSFTTRTGYRRAWPTCRRCGSSLAGRLERVAKRRAKGITYKLDVFRCPCNQRRYVKREVVAS
jgi:hypothetical protein